MNKIQCSICKEYFDSSELYEYRGEVACEKDFNEAQKNANFKRQEMIEDSKFRTDRFKGLDLGNSTIGKANRDILKADIEIAKKGKNL